MIVEKLAVKKTLAVTLALALGLTLPGGAWAQVIGAGAAPVSAAGSAAAASYTGAVNATVSLPSMALAPSLSAMSLSAAPSPALAAFAAAPAIAPAAAAAAAAPLAAPAAIEAHPAIALINQIQKAGVSLETAGTRADAAKLEKAALALPEGSSGRQQLTQLAASIRAANGAGEEAPSSAQSGAAFDGAMKSAAGAEAPVKASGFKAFVARVAAKLLPSSVHGVVGVPAAAPAPQPEDPKTFELSVNQVRYSPVAEKLPESTNAMPFQAQKVVGQDDALKAIRFAVEMKPDHYNLFVAGADGSGRQMAVRSVLADAAPKMKTPNDLVAATNFENKEVPVILEFAPGQASVFKDGVEGFVEALKENLPAALNSGEIGQKKQQIMAQVQAAQAKRQAE
ncbi:MAG TPA: hypothetical protein VN915_12665, partial [Elusimicrobiota bacterium]|nr:hypothetical protein [Elusimicrobiota bacterium]